MFTIGFKEILLLAVVGAVVWFGFRLLERRQDARAAVAGRKRRRRTRSRAAAESIEAEQMIACPTCGVYYAAGADPRCERPSCPLRGAAGGAGRRP